VLAGVEEKESESERNETQQTVDIRCSLMPCRAERDFANVLLGFVLSLRSKHRSLCIAVNKRFGSLSFCSRSSASAVLLLLTRRRRRRRRCRCRRIVLRPVRDEALNAQKSSSQWWHFEENGAHPGSQQLHLPQTLQLGGAVDSGS
jgi:hypothetical protein